MEVLIILSVVVLGVSMALALPAWAKSKSWKSFSTTLFPYPFSEFWFPRVFLFERFYDS